MENTTRTRPRSGVDHAALATDASIAKTAEGLRARGVEPIVVERGADALAAIKELVPAGASVMNGAPITLETIGFVEYLKSGAHGWNNLHANILAEKDPAKHATLRRESVLSDYYLGSVHALAETGEFLVASNTGSQLPHIVSTSPHVVFVVGAQKIVPTLADAFERLEKYVVLLEDERAQKAYGVHTALNKIVVWKGESAMTKRNVTMILVKEVLGF